MLEFDLEFGRGEFLLQAAARIDAGRDRHLRSVGLRQEHVAGAARRTAAAARGTLSFRDQTLVDVAARTFVPAWHRHFALVFQDGQLFPHLTVQDNLLYGYRRRAAAERRFELPQVLDLLEIGPLLARRPAQLSGGERQRVALGRALLYSPRLLLLDEPLASLDERLKQQILPFLRRVKDETHLPMLYVSHARAEVDYLADRTLWMEAGRLLER